MGHPCLNRLTRGIFFLGSQNQNEMLAVLKQQLRWWTTVTEVFRIKDARSLADKNLAKKIADILEETIVDEGAHSLSFYVRESSVTVFGNVKNPQEKAFVLELVRRIPGIESCNSHLRIVESEEIF